MMPQLGLARELPCHGSAMRVISSVAAAIGLIVGGCAHEQVPTPLAPADVARINEAAESNNWFRVEYVEPLATREDVHVVRPIGIESADAAEIGFRTRAGEVDYVPTEMVQGVTVKERGRGTATGAVIGLAAGGLFLGALALLAYELSRGGGFPDSDGPMPPSCGNCAKTFTFVLVTPTLIGAIVGTFVGSRRTFDFGPRGEPSTARVEE
jgi:hypothetical protein